MKRFLKLLYYFDIVMLSLLGTVLISLAYLAAMKFLLTYFFGS